MDNICSSLERVFSRSVKPLSEFLLLRRCFAFLCRVRIVSAQDSSVMSKIYDTLGRKYKAKGVDGVQDIGVCMHTFMLNFCVFLIGWEGKGSNMAEWLGRKT